MSMQCECLWISMSMQCECIVLLLFFSTVIHSKFWWSLRSQKLHSCKFGKNQLVTSLFRSTLKELWFHHYLCMLKCLTDSKNQFRWITFTYLLFRLKLSTKWKMPTELRLLKKTFEHADKIIAKKIYSSVKKIHSRVWITCVYSRAWIAVWKNTQWVSWLPFCISKVEKELDPNEVLTAGVLTLPFTGVTTLRLKIVKLLVQFLEGVQPVSYGIKFTTKLPKPDIV